MALHAGADQADLGETFDSLAHGARAVEGRIGVALVGERRREDDLVAGLDDRVDVDARLGERVEQVGAIDRANAVDGLVEGVGDAGDDRFLEHPFVFFGDPGTVVFAERRADVQLDAVVSGDFDRA